MILLCVSGSCSCSNAASWAAATRSMLLTLRSSSERPPTGNPVLQGGKRFRSLQVRARSAASLPPPMLAAKRGAYAAPPRASERCPSIRSTSCTPGGPRTSESPSGPPHGPGVHVYGLRLFQAEVCPGPEALYRSLPSIILRHITTKKRKMRLLEWGDARLSGCMVICS
eukprot:CAMPEP_0172609754 /NCGR_PEP_ID=MMETSP1068-20121228/29668_1 /TAXON_ID=35684 /ORGANISM="Pseudopedinella elastica, Strain CCMP716" /LENGTH=168 /DNA_ID=CAMNT_0013413333 /DNA_START=151 /DNA_END=658 /DNA_ORIENTATION=-